VFVNGREFVAYDQRFLDRRGQREKSKAQMVKHFLRDHRDQVFFSIEIVKALGNHGVKITDIMPNVRRLEKKGLVYVRGYRSHYRETPFHKGYLMTWLDADVPREQGLVAAITRTNAALQGEQSTNPVLHRIHRVMDIVFESSQLRELTSYSFLLNEVGCTKHQLRTAVERALQLYPELHEVKQLGVFKYYYHERLSGGDLAAALKLNVNYLKKTKGRANRVGHNWEAVPEWFIERFVSNARFWTQNHRKHGMDPKRITIHLIKSVGDRRLNAEVDRVWEIVTSPFSEPLTYVLSCKWGLVRKRHVDDFFNVLRWSKEFGVDAAEGRQIKQGVMGIFAANAFSNDTIRLRNDHTLSLPAYTKTMNIEIYKASDFNAKLHERGCDKKITVQRICKLARDENEVRKVLNTVWTSPNQATKAMSDLAASNQEIYQFEKKLEQL
jgi:hypothetical protein